jgi:hypothetical protein
MAQVLGPGTPQRPKLTPAQKAAKTLAARNSARLNQTHVITLCIHFFFLLLRALTFRRTFFRSSAVLYVALSIPGALVELWLERIGRPVFEGTNPPELRRAGEDLDAAGLTEFLWDVLYWTWACLMFAAALGDWAWSLWVSVGIILQSTADEVDCYTALWGVLGILGVCERAEGLWRLGGRARRGRGGFVGREQEAAEDGEERRAKGAIQSVMIPGIVR